MILRGLNGEGGVATPSSYFHLPSRCPLRTWNWCVSLCDAKCKREMVAPQSSPPLKVVHRLVWLDLTQTNDMGHRKEEEGQPPSASIYLFPLRKALQAGRAFIKLACSLTWLSLANTMGCRKGQGVSQPVSYFPISKAVVIAAAPFLM